VADQLGVATLLIGVNTRAAEAALKAFVGKAESILSSANTNAFSGLAKGADTAGKAAGEKLAKGIKNAVTGLKFDNIEEALNFSGALNGTIADLKTYKAALLALRDATKTTTPGFKELNGEIESVSAAIKSLSTSTDDLNDLLNRTDASRFADDMKLWAAALRENDTALRDTSRAIRDADRSLRNYDKASNDAVSASERQAAAARELRDAYLGVAGAAVQAAAGAVGTAAKVGKGVIGTAGKVAKGAVKAGKLGYDVGSALGILDTPGTGIPTGAKGEQTTAFGRSLKAVSDQFKFVAEQAQTTRGVLLRVFEGLGAGASLMELVKNADLLKSILNNLGGTAKVAEQGLNGLAGTTNIVAKAFNSLEGDWAGLKAPSESLLGNLVNVADGATQAAAGAGSLADSFAQFGVQLGGTAIDALVGLNALLSQVPLEAAGVTAAGAAALAVFGGDLQKQAAGGISQLIDKLRNLGREALQVRADLQTVLEAQNLQPKQLMLPSTGQLQPEKRKLKRLDPAVDNYPNALAQRKEDVNNYNLNRLFNELPEIAQRTERYFQKVEEHAQRVSDYGKKPTDNQLQPGPDAVPLPNPNVYEKPIGPKPPTQSGRRLEVQREQLEDDLSRVIKRRKNSEKLLADANERLLKAVEKKEADRKQRLDRAAGSVDDLLSNNRKKRQEKEKRQKDQDANLFDIPFLTKRRLKDATSSGLIGGAFPALFGQGAGASLGGGLGGLAGGAIGGQFGFGLSLIGTAIGTFVDEAVKKSALLVDAFKDPIASFDALKEASLISSKGVENNIDSLIKAGREEEAAALIRGDISKQFGNSADSKALQAAYDEVGRSTSRLGITLTNALAPALTVAAKVLSEFIDRLSLFKALRGAADAKQAREFIGNDPSRQAEFNNLFKKYGGQLDKNGKPILRSYDTNFTGKQVNANVQASREFLKVNGQLTELEKIRAKEAKEYAEGTARTVALRKIETQLITASSTGNKRNTLELERQKLLFERTRALSLAPANATEIKDKIRADFARDILQKETEITKEKRDQLAADVASRNKIAAGKDQSAITRQSLNLSGTGVSALQASASYREAIRAQQNAQAALNASPADPGAIRNLQEASAAVETASATARTQLVEAFRAARREAQDAASSLQDAYLNLLQLRTGNNGLNNYLSAQDRSNRNQETFKALVPQFEAAKQQARNILGNQNFDRNFTGSTEAVNQEMINFIRAVQQEKQAGTGLNRAQEEFVKAQNSLQVATEQLTNFLPSVQQSAIEVVAGLQALVEKQWNVGVTVNRDTGAVAVSNAYAR
jgi:uncharacterized protein YukE